MSSYPFVPVSNVFNPLDYTQLSDALTLEQADRRYLSLGGGVITGQLNVNGDILLNSVSLSTTLNSYLPLTGGTLTGALTVNRGNGETLISTNGTVRTAIHIQASNAHIGTTTNHNFNIQANGASVLQCLSTGDVNVNNSLTISGTGIGIGNNVSSISSDIVIMENGSTPQIEIGRAQSNGNSFNIGYTHIGDGNVLNRLFIQPRGASVNDTLTYTVNGGRVGLGSPTPTQKLEVNGNINVSSGNGYMIAGSSIDNRYARIDIEQTFSNGMRNYTNQASGSSANFLRWGHTTSSPDFIWSHLRSATALDNCLELKTSNSNNLGISYSTFSGANSSDGCCMVINAVSGSGGFLSANSSSCNGALHINGSVSRAIPAGSRLISSGATSWGGSGVNIAVSIFATGNMWCAGFYVSSDIRLKRDIQPAYMDNCMNLLDVEVKTYKMKGEDTLSFGLIAQDLWDKELYYLTHLVRNNDIEEPDEKRGFQKGEALIVSYEKISLYLLEICKDLNNRLKKLEKIIEEYDIVDV
jgi:hypothetical protein